ncbi:MAG: tape measure protein, partial [Gilliamella sp.]|uniref:tape measure protein n=1 Tax=Gilliamella sp. TaxID=1891236 RepID=UPI0025FAF069
MSFEAGSIYYTIEAKTGDLLTADKQVSSFNKRAQEGFDRTAASMSKITQIAKAISAALVSSQIIAYAQSWNELEDRIQNTGATASQTKDILDQLLATSDRNGRTIEESSELYIRLSNSMGELGYSTQSTLSYIDTLSNLMTINKTNALSAESAINALTKAQMKGKLAGIDAMSVFNAMPSVLKTLGKQLKKTEAEVRQMASDGKLSMSDFTDAMIAAQEETAALADNMRNTVTDGINRVTNNLKKYLGELNNSTGATKVLVDSLILMSQHVDILMTGVGALAAIYAGKYITSLANATKQSAEKVINDIKLAQAEKAAAQAALQQAQAEVVHLRAVQQSLSAQLKLAQTEKTRNAIRKQLKANTDALTAATNQQTAAQARLDVAMKATSFAAKGLRSAMALLGGPAGMLFLAAGALTMWSNKASEARQKALDFSDSVDSMSDSLKSLTLNQLLDKQQDYCDNLENIEDQIDSVKSEIKRLNQEIIAQEAELGGSIQIIEENRKKIVKLNASLDTLIQKKENASKIISYINTLLINTSAGAEQAATGVDGFAKALEKLGKNKVDDKVKSLSTQLEIVQMKTKGAKREAYIYENALNELGDAGEQYKTTILGLIDKTKKWSEVSEEVRKVLQPLFDTLGKIYDENEKLNASKKKGTGTTKSYAEEVKELSDKLEVAKLEAK